MKSIMVAIAILAACLCESAFGYWFQVVNNTGKWIYAVDYANVNGFDSPVPHYGMAWCNELSGSCNVNHIDLHVMNYNQTSRTPVGESLCSWKGGNFQTKQGEFVVTLDPANKNGCIISYYPLDGPFPGGPPA